MCVPPSDTTREFQPVFEIGKKISEELGIPLLPSEIFQKTKKTPTLKNIPKEEAQKILDSAFTINFPEKLKGKNILIFDDIIGQGTTLLEIIKTLKNQSSVNEIFVITVTKIRTKKGVTASTLPF